MKLLKITVAAMATLWAANSFAFTVGTIDMQYLMRNSSKIKSINSSLDAQFKTRQQSIVKDAQALRANLMKLRKNQSVMSQSDLATLRKTIAAQEKSLRARQVQYQRDQIQAQNKLMTPFLKQLKANIAKIAQKDKVDIVVPKQVALYSSSDVKDLTKAVDSTIN